jgi:hypothetical protein
MMGFAIRIELANMMAVQRLHDADPSEHRLAAAAFGDYQRHLHCGLPFFGIMFRLGYLVMNLPASSSVTSWRPPG